MSNQMLLATGALFILTLLILLFFQASTEQTSVSVENEAIIAGAGVAQSLITEIQKRAFDENTVSRAQYLTDSLTISADFGTDAGEVYLTQFDDVDDFDRYSYVDSSTRLGNYNLSVKIDYIPDFNSASTTLNRTFFKRANVNIISTYLPDTLKFYHIIGY